MFKKLVLLLVAIALGYWLWNHSHQLRIRKMTRSFDNGSISAEVLAKIAETDPLALLTVKVNTSGGSVTLDGHVKSSHERSKIETLAKSVDGVTQVKDRLELDHRIRTSAEYKSDLELTAHIKEKLLQEEGLRAFTIHVSVYQGVVVLTGEVPTREQAVLAEKLTMKVSGVKEIHNHIRED